MGAWCGLKSDTDQLRTAVRYSMITERVDETWWISAWRETDTTRWIRASRTSAEPIPSLLPLRSKISLHLSVSFPQNAARRNHVQKAAGPANALFFCLIQRTRNYQRLRPPPPPPLRSPPNPDRLS